MKPNIDYLCIIREKEGRASFEKEEIPSSAELVSKLKGMVENENETVLDMSAELNCAIPSFERRTIDYVSPNSYQASFIGDASYPTVCPFDDYQETLSKEIEKITESFKSGNTKLYNTNPELYLQELNDVLEKRIKGYEMALKRSFMYTAERFILANNYTKIIQKIKGESDVRMYSTDTHGRSSFLYKVTDDIDILIDTNFCYGSSSFFRLIVRYKGIEILPYSFIVRYYYANICDLKCYTRRYEVIHNSWNTAFSFVEKVVNLSRSTTDGIRTWIINEVKEMVIGLNVILKDPTYRICEWVNESEKDTEGYLAVRRMDLSEKKCIKVYPEEMTIAVQAEKITGALEFLENLASLSAIIHDIDSFIAEIKAMALSIIPKIDTTVEALDTRLTELYTKKDSKEAEKNILNAELTPHHEAIIRMFESRVEEQKEWRYSDYEQEYSAVHPEYKELKEREKVLLHEIYVISCEIAQRKEFRRILRECRNRVEGAKLAEPKGMAA